MKRKILAMLLVLCMIASLLPTVALATGETEGTECSDECSNTTHIAAIGTKHYTSLQNAIDDAETAETTIKLLRDQSVDSTVTVNANQNITLNLNGKTLTGAQNANTISNSGNLTITDNSTGAGGKVVSSGANTISNEGGTLVIEKGTIKASGAYKNAVTVNGGNVTINGGTFTSENSGVMALNGTVEIHGGEFETTAASVICGHSLYAAYYKPTVTIYGGNFKSLSTSATNLITEVSYYSGTLTIYGGTFSHVVANASKIAEGYASFKNSDGTYTVSDLANAVTAAKTNGNDTVTLASDLTWPENADAMKVIDISGLTLNLDGHKIIAKNNSLIFQANSGAATIRYGSFDGNGGSYGLFISGGDVTVDNITITGGVNVLGSKVTLKNVKATAVVSYSYPVWCDNGAKVTVESGTYTSTVNAAVGLAENAEYLLVKGGTFNGLSLALFDKAEISTANLYIQGGTFYNDPTDYVNCAKTEKNDDKWIVTADVAEVYDTSDLTKETTSYETLEAAIENVTDGYAVRLKNDLTLVDPLTISKEVELDLGEHTLTGPANDYALKITNTEGTVKVYKGTVTAGIGGKAVSVESSNDAVLDPGNLVSYGTLTINGNVSVSGIGTARLGLYSTVNGQVSVSDSASVTLEGAVTNKSGAAVKVSGEATVNVSSANTTKITSNEGVAIDATSCKEVIIYGGTVTGTTAAINIDSGTLSISGGTIIADEGNDVVAGKGKVSITGGTFSAEPKSGIDSSKKQAYLINGKYVISDSEKKVYNETISSSGTTVKFGNVVSSVTSSSSQTVTILLLNNVTASSALKYSGAKANTTINLGGFKITNSTQSNTTITVSAGNLTINGDGTIENTNAQNSNPVLSVTGGEVVINGGTFTAKTGVDVITKTGGTLSIYGGTFSSDVSAYCAEGYTATKVGDVWVVHPGNTVAAVGANYYETLNAAITAAQSGDKVVLLTNDSTESVTVADGKEIVLDLNGFTLTNASGNAITNNGDLEVTGGTVSGSIANSGTLSITEGTFGGDITNTGTLTINNGTFNGNITNSGAGSITVNDGTFYNDPSAYVAAGKIAVRNSNDKFVIVADTTLVATVTVGSVSVKFDDLALAVKYANSASSNATITLNKSIAVTEGLTIDNTNSKVTLDLNGFTLSRDGGMVLDVYSELNIKNGTVKMTGANCGSTIWVNKTANLTIEKTATINASDSKAKADQASSHDYSSFAISFYGKGDDACTGANVTLEGKITGENGITINGLLTTSKDNATLKIADGAEIKVSETGLYLAGLGTTTVDRATISGETGIEIRAGVLTVNNDATITGGTGVLTANPNGNGQTTYNAALAIAQHTTKKNISVTINGGTFSGTAAIYESNPQKNGADDIAKVSLEVKGGKFTGKVYSEDCKGFISGGYFKSQPHSSYIADGLTAARTTETGYVYEIKEAEKSDSNTSSTTNATVETVIAHGDNSVAEISSSTNIKTKDVNTVKETAQSVSVDNASSLGTLADAASSNEQTLINSALSTATGSTTAAKIADIKEDAAETLNKALGKESNVAADDLTFYTQTYMDVTPTAYTTQTTDDEKTVYSLSMDITPMVQLVVSTAKSAEDIQLDGATQNAVAVTQAQKLTVTEPVEVSVKLPAVFNSKPVYVIHEAADGKSYVYKTTADAQGNVTFTTENGFSPFTFSTDDPIKAYLGTPGQEDSTIKDRFTNLQDAVNSVKDGGTITIGADNNENIVVAKTISFYVASDGVDKSYTANIKAGNYTKLTKTTVGNSTLYKFVYTAPVYGNGDNNTDDEPGGDDDTPASTGTFTDVPDGQWYSDAVAYCAANSLMDGTGDGKFEPMKNVTRAMAITTLYRLAGSPEVSGTNNFTDLTQDWYKAAVQWGVNIGITNGKTATTFDPNAAITREQLAAMFYRYATAMNLDTTAKADLSGYTDSGKISSYAVDAMQWANAAGIVTGTSATTLAPTNTSNRATLATILMRFNESNKAE